MALRDRLQKRQGGPGSVPPTSVTSNWMAVDAEVYQELKAELHRRLIDKLDLSTLERLSTAQIRSEHHTGEHHEGHWQLRHTGHGEHAVGQKPHAVFNGREYTRKTGFRGSVYGRHMRHAVSPLL